MKWRHVFTVAAMAMAVTFKLESVNARREVDALKEELLLERERECAASNAPMTSGYVPLYDSVPLTGRARSSSGG